MISKLLKEYRLEQGITQLQLAQELHVSQQAVSGYERGDRTPTIQVRKRIRDITGCPLEVLLPESRPRSAS